MEKHVFENKVRSCFIFYDGGGFFLQRKVHQIIVVIDFRGSNATASYMQILIWVPLILDIEEYSPLWKIELPGLRFNIH
jgi:hypothetical protein